MELDDQLELGHLLLENRTCRVCGKEKNLIDGYYRTRKNVKLLSSIHEIDGVLIGGASQSAKKFIDIIKNYYK